MAVAATPAKAFTDEMLAKNFTAIGQAFFEFENWSEKIDKQLVEVAKLASVKPSKAKPFVLGAVVGVVAYRYLTKNAASIKKVLEDEGVSVRVGQAKDAVKEKVDEVIDGQAP